MLVIFKKQLLRASMLNNANHAFSESQESKAPRQGSHAAQDVLMLYHSDLQFVMGVVVVHVRLAEWTSNLLLRALN